MSTLLDADARAAWLRERQTGIGGSDAPGILGMSPFASPFSVWLSKTGPLDEAPETDAMEWGLRLEPVIADTFSEKTGLRVVPAEPLIRSTEYPWMIASLDGWVTYDTPAPADIYEGKTASPFDSGWDPDLERIPDHVQVQQQHYLAVTGARRCYGAVLIGGSKFRTWTIERDESLIRDLIAAESRFWHDYVVANRPPPIDGHPATTERIRDLYPSSIEDVDIDLPPEARRLIAALEDARVAVKRAKRDEDEACNNLLALIGEASYGRLDGIRVVSAKSYERRGYEVKAGTVRPVKITKGWVR